MIKLNKHYLLDADKYNLKLIYAAKQGDESRKKRTVGYYTTFEGILHGMVYDAAKRQIELSAEEIIHINTFLSEIRFLEDMIKNASEVLKEIKPADIARSRGSSIK